MEDLERMIKNPESQEIQLIRRNFHNRKGNSLIGCPIALAGFLASVTLPAVNGYNVARGNQTVNPIAFLPGPVLGLASGIDPTIPREVPFYFSRDLYCY